MGRIVVDERPIALETPLGPDALFLSGFRGKEALSELFHYELDALAVDPALIVPSELLGRPMIVQVRRPDLTWRPIHGICTSIVEAEADERFTRFRLTMEPALWFLTQISRSRIFQGKSVPDVLREVFAGLDFAEEYADRGRYRPRDYVTQYRESDFAFASRLMEEEGIFYTFRHLATHAEVVLIDSLEALRTKPLPQLPFNPVVDDRGGSARIHRWEVTQTLQPGRFSARDHSGQLTGNPLAAEGDLPERLRMGTVDRVLRVGRNEQLEDYEHPGGHARQHDSFDHSGNSRDGHADRADLQGGRGVQLRAERAVTRALVARGSSRDRSLFAGLAFELIDHMHASGEYVVTRLTHAARMESNFQTGSTEDDFYENSFEAAPLTMPWRPPARTPRPRIVGPQTATVAGPGGSEIHTDPMGRIQVMFHWDRQSVSSCWLRVAQFWAHNQFGALFLPRVGAEVVVHFEEGDPDRPLVAGCLYNDKNTPYYDLPARKNESYIITKSTPGGAESNMIVFDDTTGAELFFVNASHDYSRVVDHDDSLNVGHNRILDTRGTHTETIAGDTKVTVETGNYELGVKEGYIGVEAKKSIDIESKESWVNVDAAESIGLVVAMGGATSPPPQLQITKDGKVILWGKDIEIHAMESIELAIVPGGIGAATCKIKLSGTKIEINGQPVNVNLGM